MPKLILILFHKFFQSKVARILFSSNSTFSFVALCMKMKMQNLQVGIDVYIPHRKYQVKSHSSPWFSAACAAAIVHTNHFFHLYQKDNSFDCKVKFIQVSNCCKRVLDAAKLPYAIKQKSPLRPRNLAPGTFGELLIVF